MITKEAIEQAYEFGATQALFDAGLLKDAGVNKFQQILTGVGKSVARPNTPMSEAAAGWTRNTLQRGAAIPEGLESAFAAQLSPRGQAALQAQRSGNLVSASGTKNMLRVANRAAPTSAAAMPIRPAFGMANRLSPARLPG